MGRARPAHGLRGISTTPALLLPPVLSDGFSAVDSPPKLLHLQEEGLQKPQRPRTYPQTFCSFPTCPSPRRATGTWRGDQRCPLGADVSSAGAAACSGRPWGRRPSWRSLGKPGCASSCTAREKKEGDVKKCGDVSLPKSSQGEGNPQDSPGFGDFLGTFWQWEMIEETLAGQTRQLWM